jgi:putative nucleotidyltransferase with HDIG domain
MYSVSMVSISSTEAISMISESSKYEHSILVSRIMSSLAEHSQTDKEEWVLAGLLHDLDYDVIDGDMSKHGLVAASMLEGKVSESVLHAIMSHDHRTGVEPVRLLDRSLKFADAVAVLIEDQSILSVPEDDELLELLSLESVRKPWIREIIEAYCAEYDLEPIHLLREVLTKPGKELE